jgi:hypothetical protein
VTQTSPLIFRPNRGASVEAGDYFSTARELYHVERVIEDRVLLEDCRTESLIEVGIEQVRAMNPVNPSH